MSQRRRGQRQRDAPQAQSQVSPELVKVDSLEKEIFEDCFSVMKGSAIKMAEQYSDIYKGAIPDDVKERLLNSMKDILSRELMVDKLSDYFVELPQVDLKGLENYKQIEQALNDWVAKSKTKFNDEHDKCLAGNYNEEDHPSLVRLKGILRGRGNDGAHDEGTLEAGHGIEEVILDISSEPSDQVPTESGIIPTLDPISKTELTDPIRNRVCGHIYGEATMVQLLRKQKIRCPTLGCSNRQYIRKRDLVTDKELVRRVQAQRAAKRKSHPGDDQKS